MTGEFTSRDFRDALSNFATGVTIVTTQGLDGEPVGMTASSFNSVSTEPPLILWCVTKSAYSAESFRQAKRFAVHILATDQTDLSNSFAKSGTDKFGRCDYQLDRDNVPVLTGCATRFDCTNWAVHEGGDHWIIIGRVDAIERSKKEGLVFGGGAYAIAAPLTTPTRESATPAEGESAAESLLFYHLSRAYHQMGHRIHQAVRDAGLTLAEWRILASLHGEVSLSFSELSARTFLDPQSLGDVLSSLESEGLCNLSTKGGPRSASGTPNGAKRVERLFEMSHEIESQALENASPVQREALVNRLKQIVSNTDMIIPGE
ncbi:MAG: flavin reductase [Rhizobiaceae bacterium]